MTKEPLVTIQFYDPDIGYENLWASKLNKTNYRIENTPFFIYGISRHDVVTASPGEENRLQFAKIVARSGNRTLRARSERLIRNTKFRQNIITSLNELGCKVEMLRSRLLAIDVPPEADLQAITDYLTQDAKISWEFGNPENLNKS